MSVSVNGGSTSDTSRPSKPSSSETTPVSSTSRASVTTPATHPTLFPHVTEQELSNCFNPRERHARLHQWRSAHSRVGDDNNELILERALNILGGVPIEMIHLSDTVMNDNRATRERQKQLTKAQDRIKQALDGCFLRVPSDAQRPSEPELPSRISVDDSPVSSDQPNAESANHDSGVGGDGSDLIDGRAAQAKSDGSSELESLRQRKKMDGLSSLLREMHSIQARMVSDSDCMLDYLTQQGSAVEQCQRRLEMELERFRCVLKASMVPLDHCSDAEQPASDLGYSMDGYGEYD